MARLFNSTFENSLRIAILLDCFSSAQTVDMLYAADFMTIYGKAFGVSEADLNGDNQYKFSEFASRRQIVQNALKSLVLNGLAIPLDTSDGIGYSITDYGRKMVNSLESDYAREYRKVAAAVTKRIQGQKERTVIARINRLSAESIGTGGRT